jgi:hypothetical protein
LQLYYGPHVVCMLIYITFCVPYRWH